MLTLDHYEEGSWNNENMPFLFMNLFLYPEPMWWTPHPAGAAVRLHKTDGTGGFSSSAQQGRRINNKER
ncbi:MAG: hypothetical protein FJX25_17650 [Alphaproteobacteria bacterium]|nr:hypothetical protein [Alphaproteobacteria bacterium]